MKALTFINKTWGPVSELLDLYFIFARNTYILRDEIPDHWFPVNLESDKDYGFDGEGGIGSRYDPFDYIPLDQLPAETLSQVFLHASEGIFDHWHIDIENFLTEYAMEQVEDYLLAKGSQAERSAINRIFGKGNIFDFGNFSTWLSRLETLLNKAQEGGYIDCKQE